MRVITAFWEYGRPEQSDAFVCYDSMTLMEYQGDRQQVLGAYALDVIEALGIRHGPVHCELMWVEGEPVLVEAGARLSAGINSVLSHICGGFGQLQMTLKSILDPEDFVREASEQPTLHRRAANVFLRPPRPGRLLRTRSLEQLRSLPTLYSISVASKPGTQVEHVAGLVTLIDKELSAIERDIGSIRRLQRAGIFELES